MNAARRFEAYMEHLAEGLGTRTGMRGSRATARV